MGSISFAALGNAFRIPEIRKKVLFTLFILLLYRMGSFLTVPGYNSQQIQDFFANNSAGIFGLLDLWTGGGLSNAAIFGLGVMPYITASIIMQLMAVVIPAVDKMRKEGEAGYRRINRITRYLTGVLAAMQATGYYMLFRQSQALPPEVQQAAFFSTQNLSRMALVIISLTAGTLLLMWLGELITQRGVGNGISLLIFASILAGVGGGLTAWFSLDPIKRIVLPLIVVGVTVAVVFVQEGQRKIPVQYARRQVGRKMTQGGSTYLPLRVNMAGVIPIIFATALMAFPATFAQYAPDTDFGNIIRDVGNALSPTSTIGVFFEAGLVVMFTFFYTMVQFNPVDQADNLKKYGGFIPGVRPGAPTAHYLSRVLTRLTFPGSLYLATLVIIPWAVITLLNFPQSVYGALGGTTILIVVGVALDSMRQMESQLVMRNYDGFLK